MSQRKRFFTLNDPYSMRICAELAEEIGFNESVVLLQLEYLIGISTTEEHDGELWTYQSLEELRVFFPWWSIATIHRIVKSLEAKNLIKTGNYNKLAFDRTQWFAINWVECNKLNSITVNDAIFQNEKSRRAKRKMDLVKMKNPSCQNETTIPEIPTEIPSEIPGGEETPAATANHEFETPPDDQPAGIYAPFEQVFIEETGLPIMSGGPQRWYEGMKQIYEAGATPEDFRKAIREQLEAAQTGKRYNANSPQSFVNATLNVIAYRNAKPSGNGNGNGQKKIIRRLQSPTGETIVQYADGTEERYPAAQVA